MDSIAISSQPTRPFPPIVSLRRLLGPWTDQRGRKESFPGAHFERPTPHAAPCMMEKLHGLGCSQRCGTALKIGCHLQVFACWANSRDPFQPQKACRVTLLMTANPQLPKCLCWWGSKMLHKYYLLTYDTVPAGIVDFDCLHAHVLRLRLCTLLGLRILGESCRRGSYCDFWKWPKS